MAFKEKDPRSAAFFALAALLAWGCGSRVAGTEVQDPHELAGTVEQESGEPAVRATVIATATLLEDGEGLAKAGSSGNTSSAITCTTTTDAKGAFHFDSLQHRRYDLSIEYSPPADTVQRLGYIPNVRLIPQGIILPVFRLKAPGQLLGTVVDLVDGTSMDDVACKVVGTPYTSITNLGIFHFNLAPGIYTITCQKPPYPITSKEAIVYTGETNEIRVGLAQPAVSPPQPVPTNVTAEYDPAIGVVTLTWSKPDFPQLVMYGITRRDSAQPESGMNLLDTGTTLRDVVYDGQADTVSRKVMYYSIYSLKSDHVFANGTDPIKVVATRPTAYGADLRMEVLNGDHACKVGDTARIAGEASNAFRENRLLQWVLRNSQNSVRDVPVSGRMIQDTLLFPCVSEGRVEIGFRVTDVAGIATSLYRSVEIVP
ncbi:MAG: carboxypeptidase-like regulatory domain-containing protein [Fibrobacteria bacterium]